MSPRKIKVVLWTSISILSIQFLVAGAGKLFGAWTTKFEDWGYSMTLMYVVGVCEVLGVPGLFLPVTRKWAAIMFMIIMAGAAWTHIVNQEYSRLLHNGIVAGLALLVLRLSTDSKAKE